MSPNEYATLLLETRSHALVGLFLQHWAIMEAALNNAIGIALDLKLNQRIIVTHNIQLRAKLNILRAATRLSLKLSESEVQNYHSLIGKISEASHKRNMMAHDLFWTTENFFA